MARQLRQTGACPTHLEVKPETGPGSRGPAQFVPAPGIVGQRREDRVFRNHAGPLRPGDAPSGQFLPAAVVGAGVEVENSSGTWSGQCGAV